MSDSKEVRLEINNAFKLSGFAIRREASSFLAEQLSGLPNKERIKVIDKITAHILHQCLSQPVLEKEHLEVAYRECCSAGLEETETVINVIDAFNVPKISYDNEKKKFSKDISKNNIYQKVIFNTLSI